MVNKAAQALGRMGKGVKKNFSKAEIERRRKRMREVQKLRWAKKGAKGAK